MPTLVPCSTCGKPVQRRTGSAPDGMLTCRPCRRLSEPERAATAKQVRERRARAQAEVAVVLALPASTAAAPRPSVAPPTASDVPALDLLHATRRLVADSPEPEGQALLDLAARLAATFEAREATALHREYQAALKAFRALAPAATVSRLSDLRARRAAAGA